MKFCLSLDFYKQQSAYLRFYVRFNSRPSAKVRMFITTGTEARGCADFCSFWMERITLSYSFSWKIVYVSLKRIFLNSCLVGEGFLAVRSYAFSVQGQIFCLKQCGRFFYRKMLKVLPSEIDPAVIRLIRTVCNIIKEWGSEVLKKIRSCPSCESPLKNSAPSRIGY